MWMFETALTMGFFEDCGFDPSHLLSTETAGVTAVLYQRAVPFAGSVRTFNVPVVERRFKVRTRVLRMSVAISRSRRSVRAPRRARVARSSRRTTRPTRSPRSATDPAPGPTPAPAHGGAS